MPSWIGLFLVRGGVLVGNTGKGLSRGIACGDLGLASQLISVSSRGISCVKTYLASAVEHHWESAHWEVVFHAPWDRHLAHSFVVEDVHVHHLSWEVSRQHLGAVHNLAGLEQDLGQDQDHEGAFVLLAAEGLEALVRCSFEEAVRRSSCHNLLQMAHFDAEVGLAGAHSLHCIHCTGRRRIHNRPGKRNRHRRRIHPDPGRSRRGKRCRSRHCSGAGLGHNSAWAALGSWSGRRMPFVNERGAWCSTATKLQGVFWK